MLDNEFFVYFKNNVAPLHPDTEDVKGRWVMVKVDSGPGCMSVALVPYACIFGFVLFPGVPNSTEVTQETD